MINPFGTTVLIVMCAITVLCIVFTVRHMRILTPRTFKPYDFSLSPEQRKKTMEEEQKKAAQTCFDMTVATLKKAIIKKTYKEERLFQRYRTIYTIPLNAKEAAMYLWAKVITTAEKDERERIVRMAAHILRIFEENKEKHVLELEAQAVAAVRIYGGKDGKDVLQIRAVDNIDMAKKHMNESPLALITPSYLGLTADMLVAENVEFSWPIKVGEAAKKLKEEALRSIPQDDLSDFSTFPCIICQQSCSLSELKDLKCPKCRKNKVASINSKRESFELFKSNRKSGSTEQKIAAYQAARLGAHLCSACGEPLKTYDSRYQVCYCNACFAEISTRINRQKENIEKDSSCLYKKEYVVINLSNLD